jgi:hypothetical protein
MFSLIATLISTMGATGMGSILKMIAGRIAGASDASVVREKRKLIYALKETNASHELYAEIFTSNTEGGRFSRHTRRYVALIGMCTFAFIAGWCTLVPDVTLTTFRLPQHATYFIDFWGVRLFPLGGGDPTVDVTTGHIALGAMVTLSAIVGFYFTPSGGKQ